MFEEYEVNLKKRNWYVAKTGNHQGLVIDESTGENIAVTYKAENAAIVAAAPELLEALTELYSYALEGDKSSAELRIKMCDIGLTAIAKAKGE